MIDTATWYVGCAYNGDFSWYGSGPKWGDKMRLNDVGSLEIGISNNGASTGLKIITDSSGITGYTELTCENPYRSTLNVFTSHYPELFIRLNNDDYMEFNGQYNVIRHYKTLTNSSDDRLKENEVLITNACETLSKLRPQIYDKKPDIENTDSTTWYKESGLIVQEVYYDAPELRHLVYRNPETNDEGTVEPLPEIPTSIDPQQDPD